jgi:Relaxase/Mobilisation nuclease domain
VTGRVVRVASGDPPLIDIFSAARAGPTERLSLAQLEQIRRTVRRVPEVMVKVTGGGRSIRAVVAHLDYIGHHGEAELESDRGEIVSKDEEKEFLRPWHLELSSGQYRSKGIAQSVASRIKLVHNIVLGMPAGTPAEKVLAAAKAFAREKFGAQHRYVMALHTHQQHPHVHLVVKAEREDGCGRLHIDKAMLRDWRQDFARMMREQGIAANATPRSVRGQTKPPAKDVFYRPRQRGQSYTLREQLDGIVQELSQTKTISDPARRQLLETRKAVVAGWNAVAAKLETQGEIALGGDVRYFARNLPPVLTDRERLAMQLIQFAKTRKAQRPDKVDRVPDRKLERSR